MKPRHAVPRSLALLVLGASALLVPPVLVRAQTPSGARASAPAGFPARVPSRAALAAPAAGFVLRDARLQFKFDLSAPYQDFQHAAYTVADGRHTRIDYEMADFFTFMLKPSSRVEIAYGANSRTETESEYRGAILALRTRTAYTSSGGRLMETLTQARRAEAWADSARTRYAYTADGLPSSIVDELWQGAAWVNADRTLFVRAGSSFVSTSQMWNGTAWVNQDRTTNPYDEIIAYADLNVLSNLTVDFFSFAAVGFLQGGFFFTGLLETWDPMLNAWVNDDRQTATRDGQGRVLTHFGEDWNGTAWVPAARDTVTYAAGRAARLVQWGYAGGTAALDAVTTYAYDADGNATEVVMTGYTDGMPESRSRFLFAWVPGRSTAAEGDVAPASRLDVRASPDPARDAATVRFTLVRAGTFALRVFDVAGREVGRSAVGAGVAGEQAVTLDLSGLPAGVYALRLEAAGEVATRLLTRLR